MSNYPDGGVLKGMSNENTPFIMVNNQGLIIDVNKEFKTCFGWDITDIKGKTLDLVLPEVFRMSHHLAFSNFSSPENSQVVGHPLNLKALRADGEEINSEHYIVAEKQGEDWYFGAHLKPIP